MSCCFNSSPAEDDHAAWLVVFQAFRRICLPKEPSAAGDQNRKIIKRCHQRDASTNVMKNSYSLCLFLIFLPPPFHLLINPGDFRSASPKAYNSCAVKSFLGAKCPGRVRPSMPRLLRYPPKGRFPDGGVLPAERFS